MSLEPRPSNTRTEPNPKGWSWLDESIETLPLYQKPDFK